jgi:HSP20 family protein
VFVLDFHGRGALRSFLPPADVIVTEEQVTVVMDVPGLKASELDVELLGDRLTVRGERPFRHDGEADDRPSWQRYERGFGRFERIVQVPEGLDPEGIVASLADGVLTLVIPMPEARKPHRIAILGADGQPVIEAPADATAEREREPAGATA